MLTFNDGGTFRRLDMSKGRRDVFMNPWEIAALVLQTAAKVLREITRGGK